MAAAATMQRESIGLIVVAVLIEALIACRLRLLRRRRLLRASNERRQAIDVAARVVHGRRARALDVDLLLWLVALLRKRLRVARQVRLWLAHAERRFAHSLLLVAIFLIERIVTRAAGAVVFDAREVRVILPELLLRRRYQTVVVLCVLVVIFR